MESKLDESRRYIAELKSLLADYDKESQLVNELSEYYQSEDWLKDYEDDENGTLPKELKRGVLSEDGINDLLEEFVELSEIINNIKGE